MVYGRLDLSLTLHLIPVNVVAVDIVDDGLDDSQNATQAVLNERLNLRLAPKVGEFLDVVS